MLTTSLDLDNFENLFNFRLKSFFFSKIPVTYQPRSPILILDSTVASSNKKFLFSTNFDKVLPVICVLAFPPIKNPGFAYVPRLCFFLTLIQFVSKGNHSKSYLNCACEIALKIAKILAAQASAQPFKNNCSASAIASSIVAPQLVLRKCPPLAICKRNGREISVSSFHTCKSALRSVA